MKPVLDLPDRYLIPIQQMIEEHLEKPEVWAYGSRVNGQSHEASDLDLVVRETASSAADVLRLKAALQDSNVPILVDVLDWRGISSSFKDEIQKKHVVIYPVKPVNG
jgi:predicted nucleotidyltransferase